VVMYHTSIRAYRYSCGLSHHIIRLGGGGTLQSKTNSGRRKVNTLFKQLDNSIIHCNVVVSSFNIGHRNVGGSSTK